MEVFDFLSDFTWIFSQFFLALSFIFVLIKRENYNKHVLALLLLLLTTALTWKIIPENISDILYDMSLVYACYVLVFYSTMKNLYRR